MSGSATGITDQLVLRPSRGRTVLLLACCLVFAGIGIAARREPMGWFVLITFGLGSLIFVVQLFRGASYLMLDEDGFELSWLFRKWGPIFWKDVSEFRVGRIPPASAKYVLYDSYAQPERGLRKLNRELVGATDALPDTFGMKAGELAALLNSWRSRALVRTASQRP